MDRIRIDKLEIFANHGVFPEEKAKGQTFYVTVDMSVDTRPAGMTDDLTNSVNYGEVAELVRQVMTENTYDLIETCAEAVAAAVLRSFDLVRSVTVEIHKPQAPVTVPFEDVSVIITRAKHRVYLAIGSNMGDSESIIREAVSAVDELADTWVKKVSSIITTRPYGVLDQPDFLNGALEIETMMTPHELLDALHEIEAEAGRKRELRWGPRTLDLDILFYDDLILDDDDLCIPHVDMKNRDFVLKPMNEIAPYYVHPVERKRICQMLAELNERAENGSRDGVFKNC